jgi:hypothetical protein
LDFPQGLFAADVSAATDWALVSFIIRHLTVFSWAFDFDSSLENMVHRISASEASQYH